MLTFGPSPGMHAAEARLSFLCCQKSCWRLMCPFIHRVLSATESRKHFLILPEVMVWHLSEGVTVAAMPFLRHKVQNAASVFEFRSYAEHLFNDIYSRNNVLWERRSHWIRKYVYQIDQSNLCVCVCVQIFTHSVFASRDIFPSTHPLKLASHFENLCSKHGNMLHHFDVHGCGFGVQNV